MKRKVEETYRPNLRSESKSERQLMRNLPYFFFLLVLILVYIGNAHYVERKSRLIDEKRREVKELHWIYTSTRSDMLNESSYSKLIKQVEQYQLSNRGPMPEKLVVPDK